MLSFAHNKLITHSQIGKRKAKATIHTHFERRIKVTDPFVQENHVEWKAAALYKSHLGKMRATTSGGMRPKKTKTSQ